MAPLVFAVDSHSCHKAKTNLWHRNKKQRIRVSPKKLAIPMVSSCEWLWCRLVNISSSHRNHAAFILGNELVLDKRPAKRSFSVFRSRSRSTASCRWFVLLLCRVVAGFVVAVVLALNIICYYSYYYWREIEQKWMTVPDMRWRVKASLVFCASCFFLQSRDVLTIHGCPFFFKQLVMNPENPEVVFFCDVFFFLQYKSRLTPWLLLANTKTTNKHKLPGF